MDRYIHPLDRLTQAAQKARKNTRRVFAFGTRRDLGRVAADELLPALEQARQWAQKAVEDARLQEVKADLNMLVDRAYELTFDIEQLREIEPRPDLTKIREMYDELTRQVKQAGKLLTKLGE